MNRTLCGVICALAAAVTSAQAQEVSGLVFSAGGGAPMERAQVWILDADMVPLDSTLTNQLGHFTITVDGPLARFLVARHEGYLASSPVDLAQGANDAFMIELAPLPSRDAEISAARTGDLRVGTVTGVVVDRSTGDPLEGAGVTAIGSNRNVLSRWDGRFVLGDLDPGPITLRISSLGYSAREYAFEVESGLAYDLRVPLDQQAIPLEGVTVTVRSRSAARILEPVYERMRRGLGGRFIDRKSLHNSGFVSLAHILEGMPSVKIRGRRMSPVVEMRGCSPEVFVDGHSVGQGVMASEFLAMYAADLEIVEVYTGIAGMPPEFGAFAFCAIGIWTKRGG